MSTNSSVILGALFAQSPLGSSDDKIIQAQTDMPRYMASMAYDVITHLRVWYISLSSVRCHHRRKQNENNPSIPLMQYQSKYGLWQLSFLIITTMNAATHKKSIKPNKTQFAISLWASVWVSYVAPSGIPGLWALIALVLASSLIIIWLRAASFGWLLLALSDCLSMSSICLTVSSSSSSSFWIA